MARTRHFVSILGLALASGLGAVPVAAQAAAAAPDAARQAPVHPRNIQLVFEREVYHYQGGGRRDPFKSLASDDAMGPLFDELKLRMIIFVEKPGQSVALVMDGAKKSYRLRKGDVVGNATVLDITPEHVVFSVEDFGNRRQETLELKAKNQKEGA